MSQGSWREIADDDLVSAYDERMATNLEQVAAQGLSVHAEADLVARFAAPGSTVLDGGCGTGRIAWPLAAMGFAVVGVDSDARMLAHAKDAVHEGVAAPTWHEGELRRAPAGDYSVILLAGNVVPLIGSDELFATLHHLTELMTPETVLISGFGLDDDHLPDGCPVLPLASFDQEAAAAGLDLRARWGTWEGGPLTGDYAVSVHRLVRR